MSIVTTPHQFLAQKRQERTRGKLAGLEVQIHELRALGASYREIAEYLFQEHGLTVTPSGLQKHLKGLDLRRSTKAPGGRRAPDPEPLAPLLTAVHTPSPGNATPPRETFNEGHQDDGNRIQKMGDTPTEDVVSTYRLASPEHQEMMARYRQRKNQSQT